RLLADALAAEKRFRLLAEVVVDVVWSAAPDGKHEFLGPRWYEYTGQRPEDPPGEGWSQALHPEDRAGWIERSAAAVQHPEPWEMEARLRRADGAYRWHLHRVMPELAGGR